VTLALGWIDEIIQIYLPGRGYDLRDVILNGAGGVFGIYFVYIARVERRRFFAEA